ncbi:HAD family hydrolase [Laceyella putida]|uniref:HAD family hydrolase n=1 Tax=Laceyella putida TaxID=110101 RepID=A0ABW2RJN5_9BACL
MVLFDVDGVFLSEERCFDASALSVWEMLYAPHFLDLPQAEHRVQPSEEAIRSIRDQVFDHNRVLDWMKTRGLNSNWDMVYLAFAGQLLLLLKHLYPTHQAEVRAFLGQPITAEAISRIKSWAGEERKQFVPDFAKFPTLFAGKDQLDKMALLTYFNELASNWFGVEVNQFSRNSALWECGYSVYQEWYLGDELYKRIEKNEVRMPGKTGFLQNEIPIAAPEQMGRMLKSLKAKGVTVGIGTGRTFVETEVPLKELGLFELFDQPHVATATDVIAAEETYPGRAPLGKPEPYTYIKAYLGKDSTAEECLNFALPLADGAEILIVGDSVADYLAAKKMGCAFAATLTGLTGQAAREKFVQLKADYILNDVTELTKIFD